MKDNKDSNNIKKTITEGYEELSKLKNETKKLRNQLLIANNVKNFI